MTRLVVLGLIIAGCDSNCDDLRIKNVTLTCRDCVAACAPLSVSMCQAPRASDDYAKCYCGNGPVVIERER